MQYFALLIAAALVGIDRLTKWLVSSNMQVKDTIPIIKIGDTEVLNISYYLNDGAAFSKFSGQTLMLIIVTSVVLAVLVGLLIAKKVKRPAYIAAFALIIGGGIGNLIDRIFNNGLVVDFIDFRIIHFAIFNFADICAVCGAAMLLLIVIIDEIKERRAKKAAVNQVAEPSAEAKSETEPSTETESETESEHGEDTADGND